MVEKSLSGEKDKELLNVLKVRPASCAGKTHEENMKIPEQSNAINGIVHTKWNCKYHIVFVPKYRRKIFYTEKRETIREIWRPLYQ